MFGDNMKLIGIFLKKGGALKENRLVPIMEEIFSESNHEKENLLEINLFELIISNGGICIPSAFFLFGHLVKG